MQATASFDWAAAYGCLVVFTCFVCVFARSVTLSGLSFVLLTGWVIGNVFHKGLQPPELLNANAGLDLVLLITASCVMGDWRGSRGLLLLSRLFWALASPRHRALRYLIMLTYVAQLSLHFGVQAANFNRYGFYYLYDNMLFATQCLLSLGAGGRRLYDNWRWRRNHRFSAHPGVVLRAGGRE